MSNDKLKRRVVFIIPSLVGGGAERTLINLLRKLDYSLFAVDLIVVLKNGVYVKDVPIEVNTIFLFHNKTLVRVLGWLQKKIGFTYFFRTRIEKQVHNNYDVGISFLDGNFTDLLFFIKSLKRKYTWVHGSYKTNHNFSKYYENLAYVEKLKKERYRLLDGIYFVSNDAKREFIEVFGHFPKMEVLYNFIDCTAVRVKAQMEEKPLHTIFHFIALGSLLPIKGFDRLIRAAKIVNEKGFVFRVSILGFGPEKNKLEALVEQNNLNTVVSFLGFVKNPYPYLQSADVFIMSSQSEALPTVLCEAMILGKATLVTNCSGCHEIVANGEYGLMAEQDDTSLAENMIKYLSDSSLVKYFESQSKQRAKLFDDVTVLRKYDEILLE
ncbi:glycosyltransferase [Flavobacterium lacus]|uniref:Glycosyltransferase involved in cell wall biosynthesis n=1 Tax=Flavobacterium lacus TaxID=1353778 RepID=A0A328WPN2_9FLAO|nr:glycosyltransferase [Flavobacterium lacus]RAR47235.1 glycosyltransferase involved in cell wall biosynthesis [Flavobacterium lacus]